MRDILEQAERYAENYGILGRAHYLACDRYKRRNLWLGIPVIVITTTVGTTIFGTLNENPEPLLRIAAGLISLLGAVLAALQTTLGYAKLADRHHVAAGRYRAIRRKAKLFVLQHADADPEDPTCRKAALAELERLNTELETIASESSNVPDDCFERATAEHERDRNRTSPAAG